MSAGPFIIRDVSARGARVRFVEAGEGPTVVLLHGYLASHRSWEDVAPRLAEKFRVVVPDLPGFGDSEKPDPASYAYDFDAFAESIVDLLAALGTPRASVCGHAMGGAIGLTLAANHPHVVDKLVLVDPIVYPSTDGMIGKIAPVPVLGSIVFKQLWGRAMFRRYFRDNVYAGTTHVPWEKVDAHFASFNAPAARQAAYATMLAMMDTRALVARVPRVSAPTLVAWGRADSRAPMEQGRRLARELARARFEVFECGRSPAEECPIPFADVTSSFLAGDRAA